MKDLKQFYIEDLENSLIDLEDATDKNALLLDVLDDIKESLESYLKVLGARGVGAECLTDKLRVLGDMLQDVNMEARQAVRTIEADYAKALEWEEPTEEDVKEMYEESIKRAKEMDEAQTTKALRAKIKEAVLTPTEEAQDE